LKRGNGRDGKSFKDSNAEDREAAEDAEGYYPRGECYQNQYLFFGLSLGFFSVISVTSVVSAPTSLSEAPTPNAQRETDARAFDLT